MKGVSSETMFCTEGSSERWRRAQTTSQPTAKPAAIPPAAPTTNCRPASHIEKAPVTTAATATRYATIPVASLTRLSPSRIVTMRRGTPRRWATEVAAMASVGETMAPSTKAAPQGSPTTVWATEATTKVVISTSPTASGVIGLTLALKSRQLVKSAETYSKGGKNNRNTSSGSSSTGGSPGTNPSADPPRTSRIG